MKRVLAFAVSLVTLLALTGCGGSGSSQGSTEDYYNLSFSMHTPAGTPVGRYFQSIFDEISEKTNGHVNITLHGSGTLSSAADVVDMVAGGGCDIGWVYTSFYYGQYPLTDVVTLMGNNPQGHAAASHELFHTLAFCTRVVVAVTFQKVNHAPDTKASAQGNHEGLKNIHSRVKEFHNVPP